MIEMLLVLNMMNEQFIYIREEPNPKWELLTQGALLVSAGADLGATERCLGARTCNEINPVLSWASSRNPLYFGVTKMLATGLVMYLVHKLFETHPKLAFVVGTSISSFWAYSAYRNARLQ